MTTFVLLHGAYQGPWIWKMVAERLRGAGHTVYIPCLDGCAERAAAVRPGITTETQAEEVVEMLRLEDLSEVVLAGTSSGGMVMARVAERARDRVARLVFADALSLLDGEKIRDIVTMPATVEGRVAIGPDRNDLLNRSFKDMERGLAEWAADRMTLHPRACFYEPVKLERFWDQTWDASVIYCPQAQNPGRAHQERCAGKLNARWHEIDTGHYPMLTTPDDLARLIAEG
ncbi:MAG: alpha/beta hydrolase [Alphaproteobacteria bacterium]|nr:alpha/beta hydrolase [Alphaproteobacteria bacterium]MCB9929725.1 alpha/beta hydrolase [Alphaproteobacteria bacterium]